MRVIISPIGSFKFMRRHSSPARLDQAGDQPLGAELPDRDAAHLKLAIVRARTPGHLATVADARGRAVARQRRELQRGLEALLQRPGLVVDDRLEARTLAGILLGQLAAPVVI